jgi:hypothetical protein
MGLVGDLLAQVATTPKWPQVGLSFGRFDSSPAPFRQLSFETLPAFEVVLGSSCPMGPDDLGVLVLMEERLGARLTVRVSDVPVRT